VLGAGNNESIGRLNFLLEGRHGWQRCILHVDILVVKGQVTNIDYRELYWSFHRRSVSGCRTQKSGVCRRLAQAPAHCDHIQSYRVNGHCVNVSRI
jgi:hypothetical protein